MRSILELLHEVAGPGVGLGGQAEPESARVQLSGARPQHPEVSSDQVRETHKLFHHCRILTGEEFE